MVIGLAQELHTSGLCQFPEALDNLRIITVELLENRTGNGESDLELPLIPVDKFQKQRVGRKVTPLGNPAGDCPVGEIIVIMGILKKLKKSV